MILLTADVIARQRQGDLRAAAARHRLVHEARRPRRLFSLTRLVARGPALDRRPASIRVAPW